MAKKKVQLYNIFIGEFVGLITNVFVKHTEQTEEAIREVSEPLMYEGFLLDVDDHFFYIGLDPSGVSHAIRRDVVVSINILQTKTAADELMDNLMESIPSPNKRGEYN